MKTFDDIENEKYLKLLVHRIIERGTDENGKQWMKTRWEEYEGDKLSLGSLLNPKNTDIFEFKWIDERDNPMGFLFKAFRGGF